MLRKISLTKMVSAIAVDMLIWIAPLAQAAEVDPLQLEIKIPLGDVAGRIDHMAVDIGRQRLFVAELGNDSVGIVDLKNRRLAHRISGFKEPQGVGYVSPSDTLYVANAGDGSVLLFNGTDNAASGRVELGSNADNVRVDTASNVVFVGYGSGGLAAIDPTKASKFADIPLPGHPESFQIDRDTNDIYVNIPNAGAISVVDRLTGKQTASWSMTSAHKNFPMAIDAEARRVLVVFREPATLGVFSIRDGSELASVGACGDADDIFVDAKRHRAYVSCGDGFLDVFEWEAGGPYQIAHIATPSGSRTSLFVPEIDRLLLAVPAKFGEPAAIWMFQPTR
jgi:DNA-binding beta-propeller fold protein YncE